MTKKQEMQRWCRTFREQEGRDLSNHELAHRLKGIGWEMPKPKDPLDLLAKQISDAEAEEMVFDEELNDSVNRNICYQVDVNGEKVTLWTELDTATRNKVEKNKTLRRDQMVGDAYSSSLILLRWNRLHPKEEPVQMDLDFGPDVEWRLNTPKAKKRAA